MLKKITSGIISVLMLASVAGSVPLAATPNANAVSGGTHNYAEVLQKSLYFYECQQAGPLPDWNRVEWRSDSTMTDEVLGGWYDAGDHVKFNLPMAYSASMLAWGLYQYPDGIEKCGEMTNYVNNLTFVLDYLAECDRGDEVVYQVGSGQVDHTWWGPVELYEYGMADNGTALETARVTLASSDGCSAVFGEMSAALASGYCALSGKVEQAVLDDYLAHAENIFSLADASKSNEVYNLSDASGFYRSSHFYDDLFYAANWLYIATGEQQYLDKATSYIPYLDKELGSDEMKYSWGMCWDDAMQGGLLLYAQNTKDAFYISRVKKHLDYWNTSVKELEGGLRWLDSWGCIRYAEAAAFISAVASDTILSGTDTSEYVEFYEEQVNYALGDNPLDMSYVIGYGDKSALNAHHRTAHCSWKNAVTVPESNRHILYGALVGGPTESGSYEDNRENYINNEVADDYNAGFTAILCKMVSEYGGTTDSSFPPVEQHDAPEFYVETTTKQASESGITLSFKMTNHSAWPARVQDNLSFRYYMDLSEIVDAGLSPTDVVVRCDRDQAAMYAGLGYSPAVISPITQYDGNIYYVEVSYPDGRAVLPVSEGMQQCETMLAFVYPEYKTGWVAENDFSNTELLDSEDPIISEYIPVYIGGELYYGKEPDGTSADGGMTIQTPSVKPTTEPSSSDSIIYGDVNDDKNVNISDVVAVRRYLVNPTKYPVSAKGMINGDVQGSSDGINAQDAVAIQKFVLGIVTNLPV